MVGLFLWRHERLLHYLLCRPPRPGLHLTPEHTSTSSLLLTLASSSSSLTPAAAADDDDDAMGEKQSNGPPGFNALLRRLSRGEYSTIYSTI